MDRRNPRLRSHRSGEDVKKVMSQRVRVQDMEVRLRENPSKTLKNPWFFLGETLEKDIKRIKKAGHDCENRSNYIGCRML